MQPSKQAHEMIARGLTLINQGNGEKALPLLLEAWSIDKKNEATFISVAGLLVDIGEYQQAMVVIEEAIGAQGETESIYNIMGIVSGKMDLPSVAEKAFIKASSYDRSNETYYIELCAIWNKQGRFDESMDLLETLVAVFPQSAKIHNCIGSTILAQTGHRFKARDRFNHALKSSPDNAQYWHNLAVSYYLDKEAGPAYERALELAPDNPQINLSYAIYLFSIGEYSKAISHYEYRLHEQLGSEKVAFCDHGLKEWDGEDLQGKVILLSTEQGIGDEVFFSGVIQALASQAKHVFIGCDKRLVDIYERSFENVTAGEVSDTQHFNKRVRSFPSLEKYYNDIDFSASIGTAFFKRNRTLSDYRQIQGGFFKPDPKLVEPYSIRIEKDNKRPKIGISWRSGKLEGERHHFYMTADLFIKIAQEVDADFYVLQYAYTNEEKAKFATIKNVHFFDEVDLKQDIESNLAIMSLLDFSLGPATATQMFAMSVGCPVWLVLHGVPWNFFGEKIMEPYYAPNSRLFLEAEYLKNKIDFAEDIIKELNLIISSD